MQISSHCIYLLLIYSDLWSPKSAYVETVWKWFFISAVLLSPLKQSDTLKCIKCDITWIFCFNFLLYVFTFMIISYLLTFLFNFVFYLSINYFLNVLIYFTIHTLYDFPLTFFPYLFPHSYFFFLYFFLHFFMGK